MARKYTKVYIIMCDMNYPDDKSIHVDSVFEDELDRDEELKRLQAQEDPYFRYFKVSKIMEGRMVD